MILLVLTCAFRAVCGAVVLCVDEKPRTWLARVDELYVTCAFEGNTPGGGAMFGFVNEGVDIGCARTEVLFEMLADAYASATLEYEFGTCSKMVRIKFQKINCLSAVL